jgi:hypothetical protein
MIRRGALLGKLRIGQNNLPSHLHFGLMDCMRRLHISPLRYVDARSAKVPKVSGIYLKSLDGKPLKKSDAQVKAVSGRVEIIAEAFTFLKGTDEAFAPEKIEYEIKSLDHSKTLISNRVFFDGFYWTMNTVQYGEISERECVQNEGPNDFPNYLDQIIYYDNYDPSEFGIRSEGGSYKGPVLISITDSGQQPSRPYIPNGIVNPIMKGWNTEECDANGNQLYPNGIYSIRVTVTDAYGQSGSKEKSVKVSNPSCPK